MGFPLQNTAALGGERVRNQWKSVSRSALYLIPNHLGWLTTLNYSTLTPSLEFLTPTDLKLPGSSPRGIDEFVDGFSKGKVRNIEK